MKTNARKQAKSLRKLLSGIDYTYGALIAHMENLNWRTIEYGDNAANDAYLKQLDLYTYSRNVPAFFYRGSHGQFIAIDRRQKNKLELYAHEVGHIYLGHSAGSFVEENERDADLFAKTLLKQNKTRRFSRLAALF